MATINKTIRYDLTAGDHLTGPMTTAAKAMDIASRNARQLDRALASQRKAADVSAGASLALARADKILADAEDELSGKAAIARRELERQGAAAEAAARKQEAAARRAGKLTGILKTGGAAGGLFAAGAAGLAVAGPLGAAGAAIGAFGAIAIPELSKVHDALGKTGKAGQQAWAQLTPPEQQLGGAVRTVQASFGKLSATLAPVVDSVVTLGAKTLTDLMPALGILAGAGGRVLTAFLKPLDAFAKSKAFSQIISQFASFATQAGKVAGPAIVQLVSELLTLFVKVMPAGIKILGVLLPLLALIVTDLTPVIVVVANVVAATLQWLAKTHLLIPVIAALGAAVLIAIIAIEGASAPIWLIVAAAAAVVIGIIELVKHWRTVWHVILVIVMDVWHWIQRNWPLLLAIITGPVGLAILWITRNFGKITDAVKAVLRDVSRAWNAVWNTLKTAFRLFVVNGVLGPLGWIIHAAASAFGWIPGLGGRLKTAARQFDQFKANVNASLGGINGRTVHVGVAMQAGAIGSHALRASGGRITGPGGPRDDRAGLYALSNNEWVIRADSVARYGHAAMAAVNEGRAYIGYAGGGSPGVNVKASAPGSAAIESSLMAVVTRLAKAFAATLGGSGQSVLNYALRYLHKVPYVWGGSTPSGWDCSGYVSWVLDHVGLFSGRTDAAGFQRWAKPSPAVPGALAFYGFPAHHVGFVMPGGRLLSALGRKYGTTISALQMGDNSGYGIPPRGFGTSAGAGPGGGKLKELAFTLLSQYGWANQWGSFNSLENREAGWRLNATNPSSKAYGLAQFDVPPGGNLAANMAQYYQYGGNPYTALGQLTAMMNYLAQRYPRGPNQAWSHEVNVGWYDRGGWLRPGWNMAYNGLGRPEPVGAAIGRGNTYNITVNVPPNANLAQVGRVTVDAIRAYESGSGTGWRTGRDTVTGAKVRGV